MMKAAPPALPKGAAAAAKAKPKAAHSSATAAAWLHEGTETQWADAEEELAVGLDDGAEPGDEEPVRLDELGEGRLTGVDSADWASAVGGSEAGEEVGEVQTAGTAAAASAARGGAGPLPPIKPPLPTKSPPAAQPATVQPPLPAKAPPAAARAAALAADQARRKAEEDMAAAKASEAAWAQQQQQAPQQQPQEQGQGTIVPVAAALQPPPPPPQQQMSQQQQVLTWMGSATEYRPQLQVATPHELTQRAAMLAARAGYGGSAWGAASASSAAWGPPTVTATGWAAPANTAATWTPDQQPVISPERAAAAIPVGTTLTVSAHGAPGRLWLTWPVGDSQGRVSGVASVEAALIQYNGPINPPAPPPHGPPLQRQWDPWQQ